MGSAATTATTSSSTPFGRRPSHLCPAALRVSAALDAACHAAASRWSSARVAAFPGNNQEQNGRHTDRLTERRTDVTEATREKERGELKAEGSSNESTRDREG